MEINFKFEIGQIVYHRLHGPPSNRQDGDPTKTPLLIIERIAIECSGGVQLSYRVRIGVSANSMAYVTVADPTNTHIMQECEIES